MSDHNDLDKLLRDRNKGVGETVGIGGILAKMIRTILKERNVETARMEYLLTEYIARIRKNMTDASVTGYYNKGNLRREIAKKAMTFKVFIKSLRILEAVHLRFILVVTYRNGTSSTHEVKADISNEDPFGQELSPSKDDDE